MAVFPSRQHFCSVRVVQRPFITKVWMGFVIHQTKGEEMMSLLALEQDITKAALAKAHF